MLNKLPPWPKSFSKVPKRNAEQCLSNGGVDSANIPGFDAVFSDEVLDYNDVMVSNLETFRNREGINIPFIVQYIMYTIGVIKWVKSLGAVGDLNSKYWKGKLNGYQPLDRLKAKDITLSKQLL